MKHEMDHIDEQIIDILHENARTPLKVIASKVFLSSPAVSARIERLENTGVIKGYTAKVDPSELGYHIKAFINLEVKPGQKADFYPYIKECDGVVECNCVTGDYSMLIEVMFRSTDELDHFIGELQKFGSTKTQIVFSTSVENRGIPLQRRKEKE